MHNDQPSATSTMTPEAQRIAIAEACGWTKCRLTIRGAGAPERGPSPYGFPPGKSYECCVTPFERDLNAMHEAEKVLTSDRQKEVFAMLLFQIVLPGNGDTLEVPPPARYIGYIELSALNTFTVYHATAAQRSEAFLRTLNLWKP